MNSYSNAVRAEPGQTLTLRPRIIKSGDRYMAAMPAFNASGQLVSNHRGDLGITLYAGGNSVQATIDTLTHWFHEALAEIQNAEVVDVGDENC